MGNNYTQGPWSLNGYEYYMGRHVYSIQGSQHVVTMPDGSQQKPTIGMLTFSGIYSHNVVVDSNGQSDMVNQSIVDHLANAKLIATAPDLLEALTEMVAQFKTIGGLYSKDKAAINKAEAAIQKALGKETNGN